MNPLQRTENGTTSNLNNKRVCFSSLTGNPRVGGSGRCGAPRCHQDLALLAGPTLESGLVPRFSTVHAAARWTRLSDSLSFCGRCVFNLIITTGTACPNALKRRLWNLFGNLFKWIPLDNERERIEQRITYYQGRDVIIKEDTENNCPKSVILVF